VFAQDFTPGLDSAATRRLLAPPDPAIPDETFALSRDGRWLAIARLDQTSSVARLDHVAGALPPQR